ncbi:MAG: protein adenylyltransferase SelO [Brachybacterium sp.]|uniref:protein adenylyltransferase SelO n=1 Tax=Brachybacterium sp. TaxID=1891286 RepID=UPI003F8EC1FB
MEIPLEQSYAAAVPELSVPWRAEAPPHPELVWLNEELARELGYSPAWLRGEEGLSLLTGQIDGTTAQAYAGHQFGSPNPQLGDGRAVLLGDLVDTGGHRRDLHLKGAGRTPFARGGDGKAPLGPMLREAVIGEWLHALGIPTTRALAVLSTGEQIAPRQGVTPEPGALLVRVAASHLRVGTFEYATWHLDPEAQERLVEYTIQRHHPQADGPLGLLEAVVRSQAELVAQWMLAGFVHGVMNTDNMALSGEGIDYGPCAVLDVHRRGAVFSSIDRGGRYAYGNQPGIALWNLSRFAETLVPLLDADPNQAIEQATAVLERYEGWYLEAHGRGLAAKLGIPRGEQTEQAGVGTAEVEELGAALFDLLEEQEVDHTGFFRALGEGSAAALFKDPAPFERWDARLRGLRGDGPPAETARRNMAHVNPAIVPRNVHLDAALRAAHLGDVQPVRTMLDAVGRPFERRAEHAHLEEAGDGGEHFLTFCGT